MLQDAELTNTEAQLRAAPLSSQKEYGTLYGSSCKNLHVPPTTGHMLPVEKNTFSRGNDNWRQKEVRTNTANIADLLPRSNPETKDLIPLNKHGWRLDFHLPSVSPEAPNAYRARITQQKLCNNYHLIGTCTHPDCPFDHSPVEEELVYVLRVMRSRIRAHVPTAAAREHA